MQNINRLMKNIFQKIFILAFVLVLVYSCPSMSFEVAPHRVIDGNSVNLVTGQVSLSETPVKIGSESLSLSHTIFTDQGKFWSVPDNFEGRLTKEQVKNSSAVGGTQYVMRAFVGFSTGDFYIDASGYSAVENDQSSLIRMANKTHYLYTDSNGVEYTFVGDRTDDDTNDGGYGYIAGYLKEIKQANGFTTTIDQDNSITTNNGLQLKYAVEIPYDSSSYSTRWTFTVTALNNAVEYCDPLVVNCNFQYEWPVARYEWPLGTPAPRRSTNTLFKVTDAQSRVKEFHQIQFDVTTSGDPRYVPRINSIKNYSSSDGVSTVTYNWKKVYVANQPLYSSLVDNAVLKNVTNNGVSTNYYADFQDYVDQRQKEFLHYSANGPDSIRTALTVYRGRMYFIEDEEKTINFSLNDANHITSIEYPQSNREEYEYTNDSYKRLEYRYVIPRGGSRSNAHVTQAGYVTGCPNRKTCNKPLWIKDARGNVTNFEYHAPSGLISKVTKPADRNGIRPQTRYFYTQKYAWYKKSSGNYQRASTSIWRMSKQSTCRTGASTNNGCSNSTDEVAMEYDYGPDSGPNNLWLRGVKVTDKNTNEVRLTCYSYDNYGNRIGERRPKGNVSLTRCP